MSTANVAIVSGAAQGLGRAFAERLCEQGYEVLALDISDEVENLPNMHGFVADISNPADIKRVACQADGMGAVRVLINNAGHWRSTPVTSSWAQTLQDWDYIMDTNLKGTLMLSRSLVPHLQKAVAEHGGQGHILNVSADYVLPPKREGTNCANTDLYNASKWALNGFTDAWAKYLHNYDIKVNGLCIGAVDTPMLRSAFADSLIPKGFPVLLPAEVTQLMIDIIGSGRSGENFGAWPTEPVTLGPKPAPHQRITGQTTPGT